MAVRKERQHDIQAAGVISKAVGDWASYQNLAGEHDNVETSPIRGVYDWRSYLHEEAVLAQRREDRMRAREKKAERPPPPPPAPVHYYA